MGVIINTPPKGSTTRLIATAPANQTYATQAATLYTAYQNLTLEEKLNSIIMRDDNVVLQLTSLNASTYSRHGENNTTIYGETLWLYGSGYYASTGTSISVQSSSVNPGTMKLYVLG